MSRQPDAVNTKNVTQVVMNTEAMMPLALKFPGGQLMVSIPSHRAFIEQAARESHTGIFIVNNVSRLLVYYTVDGQNSSVPAQEPTDFFDTFQRLQIEAMQRKQEAQHAI